ncbi:MAG: hypothetical protein JJ949_10630 [Roseicyclus sp.]|nr:hypothetical protein [Roseicyclus sp.]MBO6924172.1 hypothetical protein [Roseicyclus sp.]
MKRYQLAANGMITSGGGEVLFAATPCIVYSICGGWYRECQTLDDLCEAIAQHHDEPGARFDLAAVQEYVRERPGECEYSGFFPQPKYCTRGVLDENFLIG